MNYFRLLINIILHGCVSRGHRPYHRFPNLISSYVTELWHFKLNCYYLNSWLLREQGQYSHLTDFILISYINEIFQLSDKYNSAWSCEQGLYSQITVFHVKSFHYVTDLWPFSLNCYYLNSWWLCEQGPYSHLTDFILISYISELFQTFDKYNSAWLCEQGPSAISQISKFNQFICHWAMAF